MLQRNISAGRMQNFPFSLNIPDDCEIRCTLGQMQEFLLCHSIVRKKRFWCYYCFFNPLATTRWANSSSLRAQFVISTGLINYTFTGIKYFCIIIWHRCKGDARALSSAREKFQNVSSSAVCALMKHV